MKKFYEDEGSDGFWTVGLKLADDSPLVKLCVSIHEPDFDDQRKMYYCHSEFYISESEHELSPAFTGELGFIGGGTPLLEGVLEDNYYVEGNPVKQDLIRECKRLARQLIDEKPDWLLDALRDEIDELTQK